MNFLAHLILSEDRNESLVGGLMGDFVKGRLEGRFPPGITRGLELHRAIDSFASRNQWFQMSRRRINDSFGLYRGVMVDLFYDHFLASCWVDYADGSLVDFIDSAYRVMLINAELLPERLQRILPIIFEELLPSYQEVDGIDRALKRMSARLARSNPLGEGGAELSLHYAELADDFRCFMPEALEFVRVFADVRSRGEGNVFL